jgi:hypothetical protein
VKYVRSFIRFWIDFVVGDDWRVALGVAIAIGIAAAIAADQVAAWWVLPLAVLTILWLSLRRETRPKV